jgi:RHS repeat-associated protein
MQNLYKYGAYGEPYDITNTLNWSGSAYRYTGQTVLEGTGLYYYKARVYDPIMGRFLQTDPIGSDDDINLYGYTAGDPVNGKDPSGNQCAPVGGGCSKQQVDSSQAIAGSIARNPGGTLEIVGNVVQLLPAPQTKVAGRTISVVGTVIRKTETAVPVTPTRPNGVPKNFISAPAKKGDGVVYSDPKNPHNNVRDMAGNPNSPNPAQQQPYVKENVSGQPINAQGNPVSGKSPESHIPRDQYKYRGEVKPNE